MSFSSTTFFTFSQNNYIYFSSLMSSTVIMAIFCPSAAERDVCCSILLKLSVCLSSISPSKLPKTKSNVHTSFDTPCCTLYLYLLQILQSPPGYRSHFEFSRLVAT